MKFIYAFLTLFLVSCATTNQDISDLSNNKVKAFNLTCKSKDIETIKWDDEECSKNYTKGCSYKTIIIPGESQNADVIFLNSKACIDFGSGFECYDKIFTTTDVKYKNDNYIFWQNGDEWVFDEARIKDEQDGIGMSSMKCKINYEHDRYKTETLKNTVMNSCDFIKSCN